MSWIVENTLHKSNYIKANCELDSDAYIDLLEIETAIRNLIEERMFRGNEIKVLELVQEGYYHADIIRMLGLSRQSVWHNFKSACEKIAERLGGYYTDEGFKEYMVEKYELSEDAIQNFENFVAGKFRHR